MKSAGDIARPRPGTELLGWHDELECTGTTVAPVQVRTLFLRGGACRFHCRMCDLWQHTHPAATAPGAIVAQLRQGLALQPTLDPAKSWLKLYNASNFFDEHNIPASDLPLIAQLLQGFQRVVVENHPRVLPWETLDGFVRAISPTPLEIAMGLETVNPAVLASLNKQMTVDHYFAAVQALRERSVDVRCFVMLRLPEMSESEGRLWCQRSIDAALSAGVRHVSIIPTRGSIGWLKRLEQQGRFAPPLAHSLEDILLENLSCSSGVVTVDLWDWERLRGLCTHCSDLRRERLQRMNLYRQALPRIACNHCDRLYE